MTNMYNVCLYMKKLHEISWYGYQKVKCNVILFLSISMLLGIRSVFVLLKQIKKVRASNE